MSTAEQWLQNQRKLFLLNQLNRRTPTKAERRKPIKVASLQHLMYHLEIDAESGRQGLPDENITIYQVDAPVSNKKENSKEAI